MPTPTYERKTHDLFLSDQLKSILDIFKEKSIVAKLLLQRRVNKDLLVENPINFIGISKTDPSKISYLTQERITKMIDSGEDFWTTSKRFAGKPGSFVGKIFKDIPPTEVEKFATLFKTFAVEKQFTFKIVSGREIHRYYYYENYFNQNGTLGNSCMRSLSCQDYFDIYSDNSQVSMLVMLSPDGLLLGRALLWNLSDYKIMDRIYTISDEDYLNHFTKWATDNGYLHRLYQNWTHSLHFTDGQKILELKIDIKLDNWGYKYYPYLDTFKWLNTNSGILTNYKPDYARRDSPVKLLMTTHGGFEVPTLLKFDDIEHSYNHAENLVQVGSIWTNSVNCFFSDTFDCYILKNEAVYDQNLEDYIYIDQSKNNTSLMVARLEYVSKKRDAETTFRTILDGITI